MPYRNVERRRRRQAERRAAESPEEHEARRAYHRRYYQAHREIWNTPARAVATRERRNANKERIIAERGGICLDCGQAFPGRPEVFDLDHRDPFEKSTNVARLIGSRWETIAAEAEKCDLVCANCHRTRSRRQGRVNRKKAVSSCR